MKRYFTILGSGKVVSGFVANSKTPPEDVPTNPGNAVLRENQAGTIQLSNVDATEGLMNAPIVPFQTFPQTHVATIDPSVLEYWEAMWKFNADPKIPVVETAQFKKLLSMTNITSGDLEVFLTRSMNQVPQSVLDAINAIPK